MADKLEEAKSLSLNLAGRQREKAQAGKIHAERNKVLLVDAALSPPTYDITLATVDSVGLTSARTPARPAVASTYWAQPGEGH